MLHPYLRMKSDLYIPFKSVICILRSKSVILPRERTIKRNITLSPAARE
jgi:hypothetical protein